MQGCARGWAASFRGGQRVALTARGQAPRKIIKIIWPRRGQSIGVENLRNKQSRGNCGKNRLPRTDDSDVNEEAGTSSVEPSSIPDGGKRRKISELARRESTAEIIILTLCKKSKAHPPPSLRRHPSSFAVSKTRIHFSTAFIWFLRTIIHSKDYLKYIHT